VNAAKFADVIAGISVADEKSVHTFFEACNERLRYLRNVKSQAVKAVLKVGDKVKWESRKRGSSSGVVTEIRKTKAVVEVKNGDGSGLLWQVPLSMVEKV
jgi:stringent starvation protein B